MHYHSLLLISTGLSYGGAETQLVSLATKLKQRGWDVRLISMLPPNAFTEELAAAGIPLVTLNMRRGIPDIRAVFKLAYVLRQWRPDVVHSHMVHANLLTRLTRLFSRIPILISTAHSINEGGKWREIAYRLTDSLADLTTNVSKTAVDRYIRVGAVPKDKIILMHNGVDTDKFRPNRNAGLRLREKFGIGNSFTWVAIGRFEEAKDYTNMLRAFSFVTAKRVDTVLLIAGEGSLLEKTKKLTYGLGLENRVCFLGVRRDIPELMNAADAYVMSSAWEGMPMVLLEAGACGLPIVATDVGGNNEVVLNGKSGYMAPPHNPQALATAMSKIMALPESDRRRMGQVGRVHIEFNYSLERVVDQWEALYEKLLQRKGLG